MVDRTVVLRRIELIREYGGILRELLQRSEADFVRDRDKRCLEIAIQAMLDVGNHVISDRQFRRPAHYEDVFGILAENGVITAELAGQLHGLAGLRDILVHAYLDLDRARLRSVADRGLPQLEEYARQILGYVDGAP